MIALPAGCTVTYSVWIDINEMTVAIIDWYKLIEGRVTEDHWFNHRGHKIYQEYVQYGRGKRCHYHQNGIGGIRLHFDGKDAGVASMFIMKFFEHVTAHNLKEVQDHADSGYV